MAKNWYPVIDILTCMECGACVFVCPARRLIVQRHKLAKQELRAYQAKLAEEKKKAEEANK